MSARQVFHPIITKYSDNYIKFLHMSDIIIKNNMYTYTIINHLHVYYTRIWSYKPCYRCDMTGQNYEENIVKLYQQESQLIMIMLQHVSVPKIGHCKLSIHSTMFSLALYYTATKKNCLLGLRLYIIILSLEYSQIIFFWTGHFQW